MGERGPVPKRLAERLGHVTKSQKDGVIRVRMAAAVRVPAVGKDTHPIAARWYRSLKASGQSNFFEPSDWAAALFVAEAMTKLLTARRFNGQLFTGVWKAMDDLLTTEQARRRSRLEVVRGMAEDDGPRPISIDERRRALEE